jgi:alpha-glucuronidase
MSECKLCDSGVEVFYNEPGGLKERASYWHFPDPEGDGVECPLWRDHEIEKLNQDVVAVQRWSKRFAAERDAAKAELESCKELLSWFLSRMSYDHKDKTWVVEAWWHGDPPKEYKPTVEEKTEAVKQEMLR